MHNLDCRRIAATENDSLCERMKYLTAFLELERAVCIHILTEEPVLKS